MSNRKRKYGIFAVSSEAVEMIQGNDIKMASYLGIKEKFSKGYNEYLLNERI